MKISDITSRQAVFDAVAEFEALGRDRFLNYHGYNIARNYYLKINNNYYDSKAIVGVAYGKQFPKHGPLRSSDFSGGMNTVKKKLEELDFIVELRQKIPL